MKNKGLQNEYWFINAINNKKLNELSFLLQDLILFLFPNIDQNQKIVCYKNIYYEKADICIKVGNITKYVGIKMGIRNSVHGEKLITFIKFLYELNIDKNVINEMLKYHYADGTLDGTGKNRMSIAEYKLTNLKNIYFVNKELNNLNILKSAINRFIIQGTQKEFHPIDVLIYGTPGDFLFITCDEIYKYILGKRNIESSAIHFSCLSYQPQARVLNFDKSKEYMRDYIQIKWYNFEDNVIEILNQRAISKN